MSSNLRFRWDGIELTSLENSEVYFDIDGDGFREKTGWLKSDDGLLVFDRNGDGQINDNSELFGNQTTGGFTELRELDSNNDGQITTADTNFANLQVWRDFDGDGRSDVNELFSLNELTITKIDAVGNSVNITNEGHLIDETASFELADGTQHEVANVWFNLDQFDSYYDHNSTFNSPVVLTEQILNLPDLRGYGNLPSLRIAMAQDSILLDLVQSFSANVNSEDLSAARELMRPIMLRWANVDGVDPSSRNLHVNAQELEFLEKFVGRSWNNPRPTPSAGDTLTKTFNQLATELETRLFIQSADLPVGYIATSENFVFSNDATEAIDLLKQVITQYETSPSDFLDLQATALTEFILQEGGEEGKWIVGTVNDDQLTGDETSESLYGFIGSDTLIGSYGNDIYYGGTGDDLLDESYNQSGQDTLDGGLGNDTLRGMADDDIYIFNQGYGHDVIEDYNKIFSQHVAPYIADGGNNDTLRLGEGITRNNLIWNFDGSDLIFTFSDSANDQLTIVNYISSHYHIENIEIEDSQLTANEIISSGIWSDTAQANSLEWTDTALRFRGLDGNDTLTSGNYDDLLWGNDGHDRITANGGQDVLDGGTGNDSLNSGIGDDTLIGGTGNDTLIGSADHDIYYGGAGNDSIDDGYFESGQDTLDGGIGNDTLRGMSDNDLYIFDRGYGHDVIEDYEQVKSRYRSYIASGGNDTLSFGEGITRNNLRWNFDGGNLVFTLNNSPDDSLTILNYTDSIYAIENIEVDGSKITKEEILNPQFDESVTIGEFGKVAKFNHNSQTIELNNSYLNPVVFALPLSRNGGDPSIVRITDIQSDSFTAYLQEAEYKDGKHTNESFSYLVLEAGDWELENGTLLEVGTVDTNKVTNNGWENLDFDVDFDSTPAILSQVQTKKGGQFVRTRQRQASIDGFSLSLEEEEALKSSGHATETVGWLAIESGTGELGDLQYQAGHTGNVVNHEGYTLNFDVNFDSDPFLFASLASFHGRDSAGLRYRDLSDQQVEIIVEEDQSLDSEVRHVNEIVDFLAISGAGDLIATAYESE